MKKILAFVNPSSRSGQGCGEILTDWIKDKPFELLNPNCGQKGDNLEKLIEKHQAECDAVVVAGGDGSVNFALPALLKSNLPLLLIPLGTANNLARTLSIPSKIEDALAVLEPGIKTSIDIGMANGIPFVNVVGLGLSSQVNRLTRPEFKRGLGVFAFIWMALKVARRMSPFRIWVDYDKKSHFARTWQLTICNGRNYGSGLTIEKNATLTDNQLHGLSTEIRKWWHGFTLIPAMLTGRYKADHDVTAFSGERIRVRTSRPMSVDIDGDIKTKTPLEVTVMPKALSIFVLPSQKT